MRTGISVVFCFSPCFLVEFISFYYAFWTFRAGFFQFFTGQRSSEQDTGVDGPVAACSGLFVSWHPAKTMLEEEKVYPDKDYTFQNVPTMLLGGNYTGTDGFPAPGTWTIEYKAPAKLYIWAAQGQYNAGVDEALGADGWKAEEVRNFKAGALSLNVWSKHFLEGSSYSVEVTGNSMVGGVVATAPIVVLGEK